MKKNCKGEYVKYYKFNFDIFKKKERKENET